MNHLLVIGGASLDVLHLKDRTVNSPGGAGMYTAMAARRCGARVTMFGPRVDPCPELLQPIAQKLTDWNGPVVSPDQLPQFEISHRHGRTEYLNISSGAEADLSPTTLPADLSKYDHVHVTAHSTAPGQLAFVQACRQRGARQISAGTYPVDAKEYPEIVRALIDQTGLFFMNGQEARALFGSLEAASTVPGKVLFITLGAEGACIIQGETTTYIPAVPAVELDPTGAGDAFCGATIASLLRGEHPIMAARRAAALAAEMIGQVGPTALLLDDPAPDAPLDDRVQIHEGQVQRVAKQISTLSEAAPFPFVSPELPPVGHPLALDYFFTATLQQFSFWTTQNDRYQRPMIAILGGVRRKGSDYSWDALRRRVELDPGFCSLERQADLSREELLAVFRADNGDDPMPALDLHLEKAHRYGRDMLALGLTPQGVLQNAQASDQPLLTFMTTLDQIGGYKEDPLRKKSSLLTLILSQRPERFLQLRNDEQVGPVIDYHLMRACLRVGLIDVIDEALEVKLGDRRLVSAAEEWAVRFAAYRAIERVTALSGKSIGVVDWFFFNARSYCPEMSEPDCPSCQLDPICAHRKGLFQPVLRTTFY